MTILETLNERVNDGNIASKLLILAKEVASQATDHLKLVIEQLPEFDIHDASHSIKIIENMEGLLRQEVISRLSSYELFLLYMSGFLHDCAMALPAWELQLLKLTEGTEGFTSNQMSKSLANDGKTPYMLSKAMEVIGEYAEHLYGDYNQIRSFIFIFPNENQLQRDLAERLVDYQNFRNGYWEELKKKVDQGVIPAYLELSDLIRYEYIRITHAKRIEKYIRNLAGFFAQRLGGAWGEALAKDLALICRSHGESMDYVKKLNEKAGYFGEESANLQFVAVILRLADILHFSHDRAPKSLFSEKMIRSKESLLHWKVKFQGINYTLDETDANGRIKLKYMAYCDEPSLYYFVQEYLNWVDAEISNYFNFILEMEYSIQTKHLAEKYKLQIAGEVDRSQIRYNEDNFTPVENLRFTLNQKKIIELLMGVGLYKDKFLCLRELYQNALDACRCMVSMMNRQGKVKGIIEFGLGSYIENNRKRTYLYCRDNGIGMTRDRVTNYFLKIGNSFYKSREFQKLNAVWGELFKPTSQFGIGILSCFMIGDKLEITTKALTEDERNGEAIRFSIDGPHEHFYFMKPDELDLEQIGQHGTLIKLFLSEETLIYNDDFEQLPLLVHGDSKKPYRDKYPELYQKWDSHIYKFLYDSIAIPNENVDIRVKMSSGKVEYFSPWLTPFDLTAYDPNEIKLMYSDYSYLNDGYNPMEDFMKIKPFIETKTLRVRTDDIEYHFLLSLPLKGMSNTDYRVLKFEKALYNDNSVLVDGVPVGSQNLKAEFDEKRDLLRNGTINFVGVERPILSVDRNTITSIPDKLEVQLGKLPELVAQRILEVVKEHINKHSLPINSTEIRVMWDYIFKKFNSISQSLIASLVSNPEVDMILTDINAFVEEGLSANQFVQLNYLELKRTDMRKLGPTEELIMFGKLIKADSIEVDSEDLQIRSNSFSQIQVRTRTFSEDSPVSITVKADIWSGEYEEYDLVSALWPVIPEKLFTKLKNYDVVDVNERTKTVGEYSNSLSGLANLDPVLIHPKMGMFSKSQRNSWKKENWVGRFENPANNFWLSELNDNGSIVYENKQDFFLFVFISAKTLTEEERITLEDYKHEEPEYYEGVTKGWSILLLGMTGKFVILPGLHSRTELISRIKPGFWKENGGITYSFSDGTSVSH